MVVSKSKSLIPNLLWRWTTVVSSRGSKYVVYIPSNAIDNMNLKEDSSLFVHIEKESYFGEYKKYEWTAQPIVKGDNLVLEIPPKAVDKLHISNKEYVYLEIEIDDSDEYWQPIKKARFYGDDEINFDRNMLIKFIEKYDIIKSSNGAAYRLIKGYKKDEDNIKQPNMAHTSSFMNENGDIIVVYHPYPSTVKKNDDEKWGKANGLKLTVYDEKYSWYNTFNTKCVIITAKDVDIEMSEGIRTKEDILNEIHKNNT